MPAAVFYKCGRCGHIAKSRPSRLKAADHPTRCGECWSRGLMEQVTKCPTCGYWIEIEVNANPITMNEVICPQCKTLKPLSIAKPKEVTT